MTPASGQRERLRNEVDRLYRRKSMAVGLLRSKGRQTGMAGETAKDGIVSRIMRGNRGKDTKPEIRVRRLLHSLGYRFRIHVRGLPGTPDIVFPARRKLILIHGCFWHAHVCSIGRKGVRSNSDFWADKFARNKARDERQIAELINQGWSVLVLWECQLKEGSELQSVLETFLGSTRLQS